MYMQWIVHRGTKEKNLAGNQEHHQENMRGDWYSSGVTDLTEDCHGQFNWLNPKIFANSPYSYERKILEAKTS